jgi:hypothetical protein
MARKLKMAQYLRPLEPIEWPDGNGGVCDQPVKNIAWEQQELIAALGDGTMTAREAMPKIMVALLPGRTWDEIKATLDVEAMQEVIAYASGKYDEAMKAMEAAVGNAEAGPVNPPSAPPIPEPTLSAESLPATAAPCGT